MAAISFGSLKQNLEAGRRELAKFKRILPYAPSSTRIQTQIIRHENSPRFQTIIPRLDKLSEKYDRLEDNFCLSSSWDSSADVIRDIKNNKVGNCGAMNDAMELMMLEDGLDAHAISLAITNKSDGGLKERVGDHLFAVLGLREDADFSDIKTWGNSAVIVDAWSNTVMAAREGMDYIKKYNAQFAIHATNSKSVFLKLPKRYDLDELLCVRFERTIDNAGVFSINNSKFQIIDKSLPPKTKVQIYISQKIGMRVKANNKIYDVQPLELISKDNIDTNSLDYHQWLANVVIELINEFYLKDAKASYKSLA